jgi:TolB protein
MVCTRIFPGFVLLLLTVCWAPTYAQRTTVYPLAKTGGGGGNYMHNFYLPPPASTPWRPSFSPDGKQIAFSMAGSIWRIGVDSDTAYELTASTTYDSSPVWSPDGRWIAYTADDNYQSVNLRLLSVATGETSALTVGSHVNVDPTWSPDGTRILYVSTAPNGWYQLYALTVKHGRPGQSTQLTEDHRFHNERLYFGAHDLHIQPTVSPDGTKMIFVSNRGIPLGSGAIWQAPIRPHAMEKAQMILREETLYRTRPQWSPDGTRIVYSSHRGSQYNNLYVLPIDGGEPYQLTFGAWDHFEPRWSPDGKWIIYVSNRPGVSELRLLQVFGGKDRKVEIRRRVYRRPMGTLDVRVFDADTGLPTEARIYLRASDGKAYTPTNAYHRVGSRATHEDFFHTSGQFVLNVPEGKTSIVAMKGFERLPIKTKLVVKTGGVTLVRLDLKRFTNLKAKGWYSGSDHIHMNYAGNLHNTPENLLFMAAAEDIDMVGVKIANKDNRIFDHQYFSGAYDKRRSTSQRLISFGQEYRPPFHGHVNFINLTQHLISPFTTGYEGTAIESLYPSNTDMFLVGKEQGALTGYVHPYDRDPVSVGYAKARAFPVDVALGTVDYIEVMTSAMYAKHTSRVLHRILNCGFKITYSGGEDSISNLHRTPAIGAARVYAHLGDKLDWRRWVDAIAGGRTFVSNGPLVGLEINGEISGGEIHLPPEGGSVEVHAWLETAFPVDELELLFNGKVVDSFTTENGGRHANIRKIVDVTTSGWFGLRARTESPVNPIDDTHLHAETGAIYVYKGKQPIRSQEDAEYFVQWIREITNQAERHPGWRSEQEKRHVLGQFNDARRIYEQRAQEDR